MKILYLFLFLWVIFAPLDPDPDPATQINADPYGSGSGYGSGSETLAHMYHFISECRQVRYIMKLESHGWEKREKKKNSQMEKYKERRWKGKRY
jgi:hypothetical protein